MSNMLNIDSNADIFKSPEVVKITEIVDKLFSSGMAVNFAHNCIAASDILQASLYSMGIKSKIVEVQLNVFRQDANGENDYLYIGYDSVSFPDQIDTHVVVVTDTTVPMLIDLSLGHILPKDKNIVIIPAATDEENVIGKIQVSNLSLTYFIKRNVKLPNLHQKNMVQRMLEDQKTNQKVEWIQKIVNILLLFSLINFTLNSILIVLKTQS